MLRLLLLWPVCSAAQLDNAVSIPPLTASAAVRALTPTEAGEGRPVHLRGHLLLVTANRNAIVLLDHTEGATSSARDSSAALISAARSAGRTGSESAIPS